MDERKFLVLFNPFAGKRRGEKLIQQIRAFFFDKNLLADFSPTAPSKTTNVLQQKDLNAKYTDVVVVGGDGTINQIVNFLPAKVPLSMIPCGSGNDISKRIKVGRTFSEQLDTLLYGRITPVFLGECNGRKFVNGVGLGFDGQIVKKMSESNTSIFSGQTKYYYQVIKILGSYKPRKMQWLVDHSTKQEEGKNILMTIGMGTTFGGGFKLTPHATGDTLAICTIADLSPIKRFLNIHLLQHGRHHILNEVKLFNCNTLYVKTEKDVYGHIDGELLEPSHDYTFGISSTSLLVRCL